MKKIYTASYRVKDCFIKFVGKGMKTEFNSLEEIKKAIQETKISNAESYVIYEHIVKIVERF